MRKVLLCAVFALLSGLCLAQTSLERGDLSLPSLVSPYYFGPNAFPIPDMLTSGADNKLRFELGGDYFAGFQGDKTYDVYGALSIPLFSPRVRLSVWLPVKEWWTNSPERQITSRLEGKQLSGEEGGDLYLSTDILLLCSERNVVDLSLRAAIKSASGGSFALARYYDSPGYFFDAAVSKPLALTGEFLKELRLSASTGFLCWQTDNARQNDAVMYGLSASLDTKLFRVSQTFGGYVGWEANAAKDKSVLCGDCPMSLKSEILWHCGDFDIKLRYQHGLKDWPFDQFRIGLIYNLEIRK